MLTTPSILTPLQITATANLLYNEGFSTTIIDNAVSQYVGTPLISPLANAVAVGSTGNILQSNTVSQLVSIAANNCPALSDSVPAASAGAYPKKLLTTIISTTANTYLGNGDLSKFAQAVAISGGYCSMANGFINSAVNSQDYLANTFTNTNSMISGGITDVNLSTSRWAADLSKLGRLINLKNLDELGTPLALVKQLATVGGITPFISKAFTAAGVTLETVVNLTNPSVSASIKDQKAMYDAMTKITGTELKSVMSMLGVTTANINTMADLLNPYKIFPNSFQTLTVVDKNKVTQNIYINSTGTVNATLAKSLPTVALSTLS